MPKHLYFLIALSAVVLPASARDLSCSGDLPGKYGIPLPAERMVRLPAARQDRAFSLLDDANFRRLSDSEASDLLQLATLPSADELLAHQAAAAEDHADQCRELAAKPFFASQKERMLKDAAAFDQFAQYAKELPRRLYPYLVKSQVGFEGTGGYWIFLKDHTLTVNHGSLGHGPVEPRSVPVVIFS